jgi:hypothetical protein
MAFVLARPNMKYTEHFCGPAEFAGSAHGVFGFMPARSHRP